MLLEDESFSELYKKTVNYTELLIAKGSGIGDFERFLIDNKDKLDFIIDFMMIFLRDCILSSLNMSEQILCRDKLYEIKNIAASVSKKALVGAADSVLRYQKRIAQNANTSAAALELLLSIREEMNDKGNRSPV